MLPETRPEPGKNKALVLTLLMHALLVAVLFLGVQWKRSAPEVVEVELWAPRPSQPAPPVAAPEPPKPEVKPEPEPPKPAPKPKPEPKPPVKPDIVEKIDKKPPKPEPKKPDPPKPEPKPQPKPPPPKPVPDWQKALDQELQQRRTEASRASAVANAESELRAAASKRGLASWGDKIRAKIRGNMTLPPGIQGNPEAVFEVRLLPTYEIMRPVTLKRSSGTPGLDAAIERAILKSSPLPKPDDPNVAERVIEIRYRPFEE